MSLTPILDLMQDPPKPRTPRWWPYILGAAIGAGIAVLPEFSDSLAGFNALLFIPLLYAAVAIHEFGHLLAGKMVGMAPGGLAIGGFVMMKSDRGWTFRFDRRFLAGGMAMPVPARGELRIPAFALMVAGGPVASILSTLVCGYLFLEYGSGAWDWVGSFLWASAPGLLSLIPASAGLNKSDGARLWMLLRRPEDAGVWMASVAVSAENIQGVRPREWDPVLVDRMLRAEGAGEVFPSLMGYYRALDEQNIPAALKHLETALALSARSGLAVRQALFFEAAEANALLKADAGHAREWLSRAVKLRKTKSKACAESAVAIGDGRFADALRDIAAARALIAKSRQRSGLAIFANERLDERERYCREALAAQSPAYQS